MNYSRNWANDLPILEFLDERRFQVLVARSIAVRLVSGGELDLRIDES